VVLLHRRKLLIRTFLALVSVAVLAACGGGDAEETAGEQPSAATGTGQGARLGPVANGDPMPPAEEAAGAIPYPGAVVWMRVERPPSAFEAIDAFTPDSFLQVVAFYDRALADWRRTVAEDAVTYHRDPEVASLIVSPWLGEDVPEGSPAVLRQARTSIGLAWRKGS
jgi:hypothetical protein